VYKLEGEHIAGVNAVHVKFATANTPPVVLTGGEDKSVTIWNLRTGVQIRKLEGGHTKGVTAIGTYEAADASGHDRVVTASKDSTAAVWDAATGKLVHKLRGGHGVSAISSLVVYSSPDVTVPPLIVTGGWDATGVVWDLITGQQLYRLEGGHTDGITSMALYNPTDDSSPLVLTGGADCITTVWNLTTGTIVRQLKGGHSDRIYCVAVHAPTGVCAPLVITGSRDTTATIWDLHSGLQLMKLEGGHTSTVTSLAIYSPPDGISSPLVLTASEDKTAVVWHLATGEQIRKLSGCHTGALHAAGVYAPKHGRGSPLFITAGQDKAAVVWDLWSSELVKVLEGGQERTVKSVAVYTPPDNSTPAVVVTVGDGKAAVVWDLQTQQVMHKLADGHAGEIICVVVYTPPGPNASPLAITGSEDKTIVVWDVFTGKVLRKLINGHTDWVTCLAVYEAADRLTPPLLVSGGYDKTASVWDLESGQLVRKLSAEHTAAVTAVAVFAPAVDSYATPLVVTGSDDCAIVVWDLASGSVVRRLEGHQGGVTSLLVYAPTDITVQVVSAGRDKIAIVWDLVSGKVIRKLEGGHTEWISTVALYVPPGAGSSALVLTAGKEANIVVWELGSGKVVRKLEGVHTKTISQLVIHAPQDHQQPPLVISGSHDGTAALWKNALLPFEFMPLIDEVLRLFRADLASFATDAEPWSRISAIIDRFGEGFWYENHALFCAVLAEVKVCNCRHSFFTKFKSALQRVVHLVPLMPAGDAEQCILQNAVQRKLRHRHLIFDAWQHVLHDRDGDYLWQVFHPSLLLRRPALLALADIYPAEFTDFICKLRLVRASSLLYRSCGSYHIDNFSGVVIEGMPLEVTVDMWTKVAGYMSDLNDTNAQPVTAYILPLAAPADMKLLQAYVDVSESCDDLAIFNSEIGSLAFRYAWRSFGKNAHVSAMLYYCLFLAVYTSSVVTFDRLQQSNHAWGPVLAWLLQAFVLRLVMKYISDEVRQCHNDYHVGKRRSDERLTSMSRVVQQVSIEPGTLKPGQHRQAYLNRMKRFRWLRKAISHTAQYISTFSAVKIGKIICQHFSDFWNMLDLAVILMVLLGTLLRCFYGHETDRSRCVLAIGTVLVWFKPLYFLRPFRESGPLGELLFILGAP
jgi:WD40 repeat protein